MTKSKMRIYGGRGYSDHATELRLIFDQDDVAYLRMEYLFQKTRMEYIRIPADDVILALWPRILKYIEEALNED